IVGKIQGADHFPQRLADEIRRLAQLAQLGPDDRVRPKETAARGPDELDLALAIRDLADDLVHSRTSRHGSQSRRGRPADPFRSPVRRRWLSPSPSKWKGFPPAHSVHFDSDAVRP